MVHSIAALLMIVVFLGHIYIGTIGMKGAYRAMKTGYVDEGWAREHHELLVRRHPRRQDPGAAHASRRRAAGDPAAGRLNSHVRITHAPCHRHGPVRRRARRAGVRPSCRRSATRPRPRPRRPRRRRPGSTKVEAYKLCKVAGPRRRRLSQEREGGRQGRAAGAADAGLRRSRALCGRRRDAGARSRSRPPRRIRRPRPPRRRRARTPPRRSCRRRREEVAVAARARSGSPESRRAAALRACVQSPDDTPCCD